MPIALAVINAVQTIVVAWLAYRSVRAKAEREELRRLTGHALRELEDFRERWGNGL